MLANLLLGKVRHMRNPKNPQRQYSLSVPHGAAAFKSSGRVAHGRFAISELTENPASRHPTLALHMKATTTSRSKNAQHNTASKARATEADGQLFLGHKVLGELRILMRLATPTPGTHESSGTNDSHRSF